MHLLRHGKRFIRVELNRTLTGRRSHWTLSGSRSRRRLSTLISILLASRSERSPNRSAGEVITEKGGTYIFAQPE